MDSQAGRVMGVSVQLPSFDPARPCPKCGGEEVSVTWHPGPVLDLVNAWPCSTAAGEHLCRRCTACGFAWCESPADAYAGQEAQPEEALCPSARKAA